jgi:hypothetical protein
MRPLRFIPPHALVEVSIRTVRGRLLLRPDAATNAAILGVLGRAQSCHAMVIHYVVAMSNHIHLLLSPRDARQLAQFMCFVNSNIAREVGRLVDWREHFWGGRYHAIVVSDEPEAQLSRLRYLLAQGVKENLVADPFEWPGVSSARVLVEGGQLAGTWIDRAAFYRTSRRKKAGDPPVALRDFATVYPVALEPLPCLAALSAEKRRQLLLDLVAEIVASAAILLAEQGQGVAGRLAILGRHPHTIKEIVRSPAPIFHAFRRDVRRRMREAYAFFVVAYREAAALMKLGVDAAKASFPEGCFPPPTSFIAHTAA